MPLEKWRMVLDTNLTGAFLFSQAAARHMIPRRYGRIVNIASIAGLKGVMPTGIHYSGYVASKGGLIALTRELAAKWAQYDIRVNTIAPGFFPSHMTEKLIAEKGEAAMSTSIPMQRIGRPGELKGVAVFLAADASNYIPARPWRWMAAAPQFEDNHSEEESNFMSDLVQLTRDGEVAIITINNPPVNALSPGVPEGISECIDQLAADDTSRPR